MSEVTWVGRKSKASTVKGSGGYTAEIEIDGCHVGECSVHQIDGRWHYGVHSYLCGSAATMEEAQAAALDLAGRIAAQSPAR
jgi:hypothetical protein